MERKLVRHGKSTLILSLPSKWLKKAGLSKGDKVGVEERGDGLLITALPGQLQKKEFTLNVTHLDRTSLYYYIFACYKHGFDKIIITFDSPHLVHYRKDETINIYDAVRSFIHHRLMNIEITKHTDHELVLEEITPPAYEDFIVLFERILVLTTEMSYALWRGMDRHDTKQLSDIEAQHDNITKLISYCLRLIAKFGYARPEHTPQIYHLLAQFDKIVDILKYAGRDLLKYGKPVRRGTKIIADQVHNSLILFKLLYYDVSQEVISSIEKNRIDVKNAIWSNIDHLPEQEVRIIAVLTQIQELIVDLVEHRLSLDF